MASEITTPRLGWSMDEGVFQEWLKREGEWVAKGDMLFVLEGEKAAQEIESFDSGYLRIPSDAPRSGDTVVVGQLLGYLVAEGEAAPFEQAGDAKRSAPIAGAAERDHDVVAGPAARRMARQCGVELATVSGSGSAGRVTTNDIERAAAANLASQPEQSGNGAGRQAVTPRARRAARIRGVDLNTIKGTGRGGRVRERDVLEVAQAGPGAAGPGAAGSVTPHTGLRRTIARRMMAGAQQTAPVTLTITADADNLVNLRGQFAAGQPGGFQPGISDLLLRLTAAALADHPLLVSQWTDRGLVAPGSIDIALAVDIEGGLVAPVVRRVAERSLREIAAESKRLIEAARAGSLSIADLEGAAFTISNLGMFDIETFTPIITPPQCAVLGVGCITREPVARGDEIVIGRRMRLSLTFDHRIVDGAPAAKFLRQLCRCIENPGPWLVT